MIQRLRIAAFVKLAQALPAMVGKPVEERFSYSAHVATNGRSLKFNYYLNRIK